MCVNQVLSEDRLYPFEEIHEAARGHDLIRSIMAESDRETACKNAGMMTEAKLRPIVTRRIDSETLSSHKIAKPSEIDQWSKDLKHPRKAGMEALSKINRLRNIYQLHPFDGGTLF